MEQKKTSRALSQSEAFSLIEAYFRSGMKGSQFYRSRHISEWQFYKWKKRYLDVPPERISLDNCSAKKASLLQPVTIIGKPSRAAPRFEVVYPGGVTLRVGEGTIGIQLLREPVNL